MTSKLNLGNFSVSLAVKDLKASRAFYEKLGFTKIEGDEAQNFLIMQGPTAIIGLFQGMFEKNILTFNPGMDRNGNALDDFKDVRAIQKALKEDGVELVEELDPAGSGPGHISFLDPDGNPVLIDQHV